MQPFELPDFYVPWPARLNPNLEAARVHSKAWAREMGILEDDAGIWSEHAFDRHDYALFCAYVHPEAPSPELNLMTDWNVWGFYVDDYFLQVYMQPKDKDHAGAKEYLDRMLLFMPVDLNSLPVPISPTERGLADVWLRTASTKSAAWRVRIIESTRSLLEACIWELDSMSQQRLSNPIEYISVRRQIGGALWSADLIEHVMFIEIPERIAATRPIQILKNSFADAVHLRNDIFSYEREVLKEGQFTNAVLVFERFLDVDTQRAVNIVNDLLTSRLHRFEHIVLTELTELFQEYALDLFEQTNVLTYIRGLQDFQSGAHEWHIQTSRYLNPSAAGQTTDAGSFIIPGLPGMGAMVMHITPGTLRLSMNRFNNYKHIPHKKVGPTCLPNFYMPFTTQMNPDIETARRYSKTWACQMGIVDTLPGHPSIFIWDERRFDAGDLALVCALAFPTAPPAQLNLNTCWMVWATYADDYFPAIYWHTRDMVGAKIAIARLFEFIPVEPGSYSPVPLTPVERGLADLWRCSTETLSAKERRLFYEIIEGLIVSWIWELSDYIQNRIPDPIDYFEMRRKTFGIDFLLAFTLLGKDREVPPDVYRTRTMQELNNTAGDYIWLTNDITSYQKEIEFNGEMHNGVLVIENFMGCEKEQAVEIANKLMTARMQQFEHIVKTELPVLFENFDLNTRACEQLLAHVEELKRYMSSVLEWHIKTGRYKEADFNRSPEPFAAFQAHPTGPGTSAAHIMDVSRRPAMRQQTAEAPRGGRTFAVSHLSPPFARKKEEIHAG